MGIWDFEPVELEGSQYEETDAMPGSAEKVAVLAQRVRAGTPLWHPQDRADMEAPALARPSRPNKPR